MQAILTTLLGLGLTFSVLTQAADPGDAPKAAAPDLKELVKLPAFTNSVGMIVVRISSKLWVSKFLVTQLDYRTVTGGNPSKFPGDQNPVDTVSWNDARGFCAKLNEAEKQAQLLPPGLVYNLPTQKQWESFSAGASLDEAATSQKASRSSTAPVGSLGANRLGLYDVRGNLWQWCLDDKPFHVLRGGAWNTSLEMNLRPEFRWYPAGPDDKQNVYGFRCVLEPGASN